MTFSYAEMKSTKVNSLSGFIDEINCIKKRWDDDNRYTSGADNVDPAVAPWFRGLASCAFSLTPSLSYMNDNLPYKFDEFWFCEQFRKRAVELNSREIPQDNLDEWLFQMRHYGAPSRLMDWTEGALIALFFAVDDNEKNYDDAIVYMIQPFLWNKAVSGSYAVTESRDPNVRQYFKLALTQDKLQSVNQSVANFFGRYALAVRPTVINRRMVAQRSVFTIHGSELTYGDEKVDKDLVVDLRKQADIISCNLEDSRKRNLLASIKICGDAKRAVKKELELMGVTSYTLFPDLDGLVKELVFKYSKSDK
jgi:hypothetical protein